MSKKILISTSSFGKCGSKPLKLLENEDYDVVVNPFGRKMTSDEVIMFGKDCIGIIAGVESLNSQVLKSLHSLRCISRVGVGIDNIDLECARNLGIVIQNTPDGPTRAVAELTIGLILNVLRKISYHDREMRKNVWNEEMGQLLHKKKIGIIGLGRIGKKVAEILLAFDVDILTTDIKPDFNWIKKKKISLLSLNNLLAESDIICIHVSSNMTLIGKKELDIMKKGAILINVSRGHVIDENAVYTALKNNHLYGSAFDVFNQEPYSGPLKKLDNVVLTPHIGSYAKESRIDMEIQAVKNLLEVLN